MAEVNKMFNHITAIDYKNYSKGAVSNKINIINKKLSKYKLIGSKTGKCARAEVTK